MKTTKSIKRFHPGLITEKGSAFSFFIAGGDFGILPEWNYRVWWVQDMIAKAILEKYEKLKTKKDKEPFRMTEEEMRDEERILQLLKIKDDEEYRKTSCKIEFSCSDLRDRTNQKRLTNGEIFKLVKEFKKQVMYRQIKRKIIKNGKVIPFSLRFIHPWNIEFHFARKSNRHGTKEFWFEIFFDTAASIDFANQVRLGLFDYRPESYYHLRGQTQLIIRSVGWTKNLSRPSLKRLVRLAGIKHNNRSLQQKQIESYLEEAEEAGFINAYEDIGNKEGKGLGGKKDITYFIDKVDRWPRK